jgi:hypothetical protein
MPRGHCDRRAEAAAITLGARHDAAADAVEIVVFRALPVSLRAP